MFVLFKLIVCVIIQFDLTDVEQLRNENYHLRAKSEQFPQVKQEVKDLYPVKPKMKIESGKCTYVHTECVMYSLSCDTGYENVPSPPVFPVLPSEDPFISSECVV